MLVRLLVKMLCILVLCPALLVAVQTLTIDSQLGTSVEDCFERISIGEQLPPDAIYRNVSELTTRECEQICKQDKQCQTYDYGVGAKGNATCNLSMFNEKELKEKNLLRRHPDYDVYIRRFQCEQSPPSPLQSPQFDDPGDGPAHRPVFRPDEDESKRPERPLDDYLTDSRPFESRPDLLKPIPPYRPYNNHIDERPDDYFNQKPAYDSPPSYGAHKPQDIPYKPNPAFDRPPNYGAHKPQNIPYKPNPDFDRPPNYGAHKPQVIPNKPNPDFDRPPSYGAHKPQDIPYKPNKPYQNESLYKPDPYDVLQFQEPYRPMRPLDPGFWRPDPYHPPHLNDDIADLYDPKPIRPNRPNDLPDPFGLEKPQYHYIIRPNRRPRPELDSGYGIKPLKPDYPSKPDPYGTQDLGHPSGPVGPPDPYRPPYDYPSRPYEKPSYSYNSQYASNYGQSQDNSIYLEIYDPPRPYRPPKRPVNDRPSYGSGQSGYGQNYGYGGQGSYSYGSHASQNSHSQSHSQSYGQGTITELDHLDQNYHRPQDLGYRPQKPAYGSQISGNGTSSSDTSQGYGSQTQKPSGETQRPSYGSNQGYVSSNHYGNDQSYASYGFQSSQSYGSSNRPSYGNQDDNQSGYGLQKPQKPNDSNQKPSYGSNQGYETSQPSYDGNHGSYGGNHGSYGIQQSHSYSEHQDNHYSSHQSSQSSGYGISRPPYSDRPSYSDNQPAYGSNRPYGDDKPSYGNDRPSYGNEKPAYGNDKPPHGNDKPSYGNDKPSYSDNRPFYGNDKPSYGYDRPTGNDRPSYGDDRPSYGNDRPSYGNDRPSYGNDKPSYGNDRPSYSNDRPSYGEKPSYDSNGPAYGDTSKPVYDNHRPGYSEASKPSYDNRPSYGDSKPSYENNSPSYGNNRPSFDNNRPDPSYGNNRPSHGSNQDSTQSSYGSQGSDDYKNSGLSKPSNQDKNQRPGTKPVETRPNQTDDRPNIKPVYEYELEKPSNVPSYIVRPGGEVITSRPVTVGDYGEKYGQRREPGYLGIPLSYKACFRRVLAGKRALRSFVRKVVTCERLEDCRRECADERRFHCESFNYRLDPSFRGKGLCELMTKPIEAFDISRDFVEDKNYDFYEVDRNSLEPHCPESLGGPGLLHSGFLSSKPNRLPNYQNQWDRKDWQDSRFHRDYDRFYEEKMRYGGGRRRYQDQFYIPYQIGVGRSSEADIENWGTYGGVYGGYDNYYKDRNDYYNSVNHWQIPNNSRTYGVKPGYNSDFDYYSLGKEKSWESHRYGSWKRGRWNSSGANGLDYGESNYYKPHKPHHYAEDRDDDGGGKDCSSRRRPGMSLGSGAIRRSLLARNVVECEAACFEEREFKCVSYSYRYSSSRGTDNCFLSERPYRGLELSADSGSDVYAMPQDQGCSTISHKPWVESECFWHVRSEAAVSGSAVRSALTVTGLGACEAECIRAHAFFCRGFSFRYDTPSTGDELPNCILTSSPPTSLAGGNVRRSFGHELYARGNYGRGCEPALYDDARHSQQEDGECYLQYDNAAKLVGAAVRGQARVRDEQACGAACTEAPFRCLSFSFNNHAPQGVDNCLLSEIRLFDLQRGVDYQHSVDDWLFAFDLFNGQCWRKVHGKHAYEEPSLELPRPLIPGESGPSGSGHPSAASEPYLPASGPPSGPGYPASSPSGPDYKPGYPASSPSGPGYKPSYPSSPGYHEPSAPEPSGPGYKPGYRPSEPSAPGYLPKPGFQPPFRPSEPSGPSYSQPDYRPDSSGPSYSKPDYRPDPSGPSYSKPDYRPDPSGPSYSKPDYRPDQSGPSYLPRPRPGYGSEPSGPSYLPRPRPEYRPDPIGSSYSPGDKPAYRPPEPHGYPNSGFKPGYPPPRLEPGYRPGEGRPRPYPERPSGPSKPTPGHGGHREEQEPISVSWRHYTVSGFPCRAGTTCAQNKVAGHWACEPEGGEVGSWDYCCAPTHRCGYSEGFPKPWCYVGTMEDQWRPCSEKYYPYHQHNIPHPSQGGHREDQPRPPRPQQDRPSRVQDGERPHLGPYATEAERKYWDELYKNGPQAYYDKYGNPLPGYTKVPTASRPYIKYRHNYQGYGSGTWVPVAGQDPAHASGGLGAPRYWPVAYLHKGPPPNMTYFVYNETQTTTTTETYTRTPIAPPRENPPQDFNRATEKPKDKDLVEARNHRDEKTRNITDRDIFQVDLNQFTTTTTSTTTTSKPEVKLADSLVEEKEIQINKSEVEMIKPENVKEEKESETIKGIDDKLEDFTSSIEVLDIEDAAKGEKISDLKTLEAEERQIEAIGRLLASRRGSKLVLEKRSQKDLETKSIAVDKDLVDFNFGNRFPTTERRGIIQKVTKDEIERERNADKSLEVSETTFVRPPRVLSTTENIRKAIVNGKVFYDATIREQRDIFSNATRKAKGLRHLEDARGPSVITNSSFGKKKVIKARNVNPVRRVRRVYRKRYNPEEVRRRLIERERSMKMDNDTSRKL